jgi:integral membrane protein (TIGR01906 family)
LACRSWRYHGSVPDSRTLARSVVGSIIAIAVAIVILAASVAPFLSPAWVGFEQDRVGAAALTGFSEPDLHRIVNAILGDLVLGSGDFGVTTNGSPGAPSVLNDRERSHMRDVRGVFEAFGLLTVVSLVVLGVAARRSRSAPVDRRRLWRSVRRGAQGLAVGVAIAAGVALVAFDAAFEVIHSLFFAPGTFDFDPTRDRIVQLFPDAFWSETTLAVGVVAIVAALGVAGVARRREAAATDRGADPMPASASPAGPARGERSATSGASR